MKDEAYNFFEGFVESNIKSGQKDVELKIVT